MSRAVEAEVEEPTNCQDETMARDEQPDFEEIDKLCDLAIGASDVKKYFQHHKKHK